MEFLYSQNDKDYSKQIPKNLTNGEIIYVKVSVIDKTKYYLPADFENKIYLTISGLPDSRNTISLKRDTEYEKQNKRTDQDDKRFRLGFPNLPAPDWSLAPGEYTTRSPTSPWLGHPNNNITKFSKPKSDGYIWIDFDAKDIKSDSEIWFKFQNNNNHIIYKYKLVLSQVKLIPRPQIKYLENSEYNRPASTRYSTDARPAFEIKNPAFFLDKVVVSIKSLTKNEHFQIDLKKQKDNVYIVVAKGSKLKLRGNQRYRLHFLINSKHKNTFFSEIGGREDKLDFNTKTSRSSTVISKVIVRELKIIKPKTSTSKDGSFNFYFNDFSDTNMEVNILGSSELELKKTKKYEYTVNKLQSEQQFQLVFSLKESFIKQYHLGVSWTRSADPHKYSTRRFIMSKQTYKGIPKPSTLDVNFQKPTTKTSIDGNLQFKLHNYDDTKMTFTVISEINGLRKDLPSPQPVNGQFEINNLQNNQKLYIHFHLKNKKDLWSDGKKDIFKLHLGDVPLSNITGFEKPTFSVVDEKPTRTSISRDGELIIQVKNFDDSAMILNTNLGVISKTAHNLWKLSKLRSDQKVKITLRLKDKKYWNTKDKITEPIIFTKTTQKVSYQGIERFTVLTNSQNSKFPKTFASADGELGLKIKRGNIIFTADEIENLFKNIDYKLEPNVPDINFQLKIKPFKIINLKNNQVIKLSFKPKTGHYWKDGTENWLSFSLQAPELIANVVEQPKVKDISVIEWPSDGYQSDGIIKVIFDNLDPRKLLITSNIKNINNLVKNSIRIAGIKSAQKVSIKIVPKPGYAWKTGDDISIDNLFTMDKILDFPSPSTVTMNKKDPDTIGGTGYVNITKIDHPKYQTETNIAADLEYSENFKNWKKTPIAGIKLEGKNGYSVRFRWKLKKGYQWSQKLPKTAPPTIVLKNPGAASVPKIQVSVTQIAKPKGKGFVSINPFLDPNGAILKYKINKETKWKKINAIGKSWEGKNNFKIQFKWFLKKGFVWDKNQPQKITNAMVWLRDPIDVTPPQWRFKTSVITDSKIIQQSNKLYQVDLKYYYKQKILLDEVKNLFEAIDKYGIYTPQLINTIFSKSLIITKNNSNAVTLEATDLAGNKSRLVINIFIKYKIEDLSNVVINEIKFKNSFSGFGQIQVDSKKIPMITFKEKITDSLVNINNKNIFAVYQLIDKDGKSVDWIDNQNQKINGWSRPDLKSLHPFGTNYPKNLANGQTIKIKFIPKAGYKIKDYLSNEDALLGTSKPQLLQSSRVFEFKVKGLTEIIKKSLQEPKYVFLGNDRKGKVNIVAQEKSNVFLNKAKYLVQIFRPYFPKKLNKNGDIVDKDGNAIYGFEIYIPIKNNDMNDDENWHLVAGVPDSFSAWNLDITAIRKLWQDSLLSTRINNVNEMIDSFVVPGTINKLANFYSLRVIERANNGWGYKYKNSNKVYIYPQEFTRKITWKAKQGSFYLGKKVENLSIDPIINIMDNSFFLEIKPTLGNTYKYEGDVSIVLSYYPSKKKGDKFLWKYKILDKNNKIVDPYSQTINISNIRNGYKLVLAYQAIPPFTLSKQFSKMERVFLIEGLKTKIDISSLPRPKLIFSGLINYGTVVNLSENNLNSKQIYDRTSGFPVPQVKNKNLKLKWQYRVFKNNPQAIFKNNPDALVKFKWSDKIPTNLNNKDYVQVRIAPVDNNKYGVEPQIYSIDARTKSSFVQVHNLEINYKLFKNIKFEISGDASQNIIQIIGSTKLPDYQQNFEALVFEAKNENSNIWRPLSFFNNKLKNNMILSFRSYAKDDYLADLPAPNNNNNIKIVNGKKNLQFPHWKDLAIKGLKKTIRFTYIEIKEPFLRAMDNTPWAEIGKNPSDLVIPSGWAMITGQVVNPEHLNSAYYEDDDGNNVMASDQLEIQYQLLEYYQPTNKIFSRGWSTIAPTNLKNKDQIQIRIVPKDPQNFQLDWKREIIFKVQNLYEYNKQIEIKPPKMIFSGINGNGTAIPEISSPSGYRYFYQVYNQETKLINDWSQNLPKNLHNHYYVKSRISKQDTKINKLKKVVFDSGLQKVSGLFNVYSIKNFNTAAFLETRVLGRINHKAYLLVKLSIIKELKQNNYQVEYIVYNEENKKGKRYLTAPKNLSNGDKIEIEIFNKRTAKKYNLSEIEKQFKTISVTGLIADEPHTKTMSKAIWIPAIIITLLLMLTTPIYIIRRKRKFSI